MAADRFLGSTNAKNQINTRTSVQYVCTFCMLQACDDGAKNTFLSTSVVTLHYMLVPQSIYNDTGHANLAIYLSIKLLDSWIESS
jgi:hypothetical protein